MDILAEMAYEIKQIKSQLANMMRLGNVAKVHAAEGLVDVAYDDLIIERMPVFMRRAGEDREYWMPSVGEQGVLLSPSGDLNNAMFLVGLNSAEVPVPRENENLMVREWKDGTFVEIDRDKHIYRVEVPNTTGEIVLKVGTTEEKTTGQKIERVVSMNKETLDAIAKTILGAILYPTGLTNLQCAVGAIFFPPTPPPVSPPSPPAGSDPDSDGNVTKIPSSEIDSVDIRTGSDLQMTWTNETMSLVITTPIPVLTPAGPGSIAAGTYPIALTGTPNITLTDGDLNLTFPERNL